MNRHKSKRGLRTAILGGLSAVGLLIPAMGASPASSMTRLERHVPLAASGAKDLGRLDGSARLTLSIPLQLRDPDGLQQLLGRLYDPQDALYHQFLSPREFADRFAATPDTVAAVTSELTNLGLNVTESSASRTLVKVEGSVSAIENAFSTELHLYQDSSGRRFRGPTANPLVKQAFADQIQMIAGLQTALRAHTHLRARAQETSCPAGTNAPTNGYSPAQLKQAYNLAGTSLNGSGQTLGLFECDGYSSSDITAYANQFGLGTPKLSNVLVDGASGTPSQAGGGVEVELDIEAMLALAPDAAIRVYMIPADTAPDDETPNGCTDQEWMDQLQRIVDDNSASVTSNSWAYAEADAMSDGNFLESENTWFSQMAAQGQAFLAAAGDDGADNGDTVNGNAVVGVQDPASQPYVLGVGGTSLSVTSSGAYASESVWNDKYGGGGGGISQYWPAPSWQVNTATKANGANSAWRSVPDVSLNADPCTGYAIYFTGPAGPGQNGTETYGGGWQVVAGTSAASPLWAAFLGLANEQRAAAGLTPIGYPNPTIYQLGEGSAYAQSMHDVTTGNNDVYYAVTGYDLASGWGSFNGGGFLQAFQIENIPPVTPTNFHVQAVNP